MTSGSKALSKTAKFVLSSLLALSAGFLGSASLQAEGLERHGLEGKSLEVRSSESRSLDGRGQAVSGTLRNVEFLPKVSTSRPPARPRKFLRRRNLQVQVARDEKYLQLLLVSLGFVGMLILILVLRSMPPAKKSV